MYRIEERLEWGKLATFVPNKKEPVYNWYYYKEGFAKDMVFKLAEMLRLEKGQWVLDPFCGVGTTMLACRQLGLNSMGFDVHPVPVFASRVKLADYNLQELEEEIHSLLGKRFTPPKITVDNPLIKRAFAKPTLQDVIFFRNNIMLAKNQKIRDFLVLGLMNAAMKASYVYKDGAVIKIRKKPVPPLRHMLRRTLFRMLGDLRDFQTEDVQAFAEQGDARRLGIEDEKIDAVITSPPYLNKIEYTRIYEIEQKLFLDFYQTLPHIRSYIGLDIRKLNRDFLRLSDIFGHRLIEGLPPEAKPYLMDMLQSIEEMYRVCKKGAKLGIIVGNGCFPAGIVESDVLLSRIAEDAGFRIKKILVLNKRWCTRRRTQKIGIARESLLLWEKV